MFNSIYKNRVWLLTFIVAALCGVVPVAAQIKQKTGPYAKAQKETLIKKQNGVKKVEGGHDIVATTPLSVGSATKEQILVFLKHHCSHDKSLQFITEAVELGPDKNGFIGTCKYPKYSNTRRAFVFEQTPSGLRNLLDVIVEQGFNPITGVYKGYYYMFNWSYIQFLGTRRGSVYRWNGNRFVFYFNNDTGTW